LQTQKFTMSDRVITIKEIARQAALSIGTVDRVLHGRGRFSKKTEAKIKTIIKNTGYRPNIHARNLSLQSTHEFGVIIPFSERDSDYWEILQKGINRATGELSSFNVHRHFFFFSRYAEDSFKEACTKALEKKIGGLIIAPVLLDACRSFVESLPPGIPFVYVDSTIPGTTPLACIGQNSRQSGICAARLMQMLVGKECDIAVMRMMPNDFHINERVEGFCSYAAEKKSMRVHVFDVNGSCDDTVFAAQVKSITDEIVHCKGLFVTNAAAYRVVKALRSNKCAGMRIIGYDCIEQNRLFLTEGFIDFIISQNTEQQGYMAINTLFRHLVLKESCAREIRLPIDIVMAENVSDQR
jgi:LacI family transcriptional regulator